MQINIQRTLEEILPWLLIGVGIALFIGLMMVLSYVFLWGLIIGALLWLGVKIKTSWGKNKSHGSVIEHSSHEK